MNKVIKKRSVTTEEYANFCVKMWSGPVTKTYAAIGLGGEAGEVLNEVKKELRTGDNRSELILYELGDTLYYLAMLADFYGYSLKDVMEANISKLEKRHRERD